jgi:DNA-binding transcriptional ArsR family regulator
VGAVKQQGGQADKTLLAVVGHPVRARAFMVLAERTASPSEIAAALGVDLNDVSYHVRRLEELKVIELVDTQQVRGAVKHYYRAIQKPLVWAEEYARAPQDERNDLAREVAQVLFADVTGAIASEDFSSRSDNCVSRVPMVVDEEGWSEVSAIMERTLKEVMEAQARSEERGLETGTDGIRAEVGLLLFERERNK